MFCNYITTKRCLITVTFVVYPSPVLVHGSGRTSIRVPFVRTRLGDTCVRHGQQLASVRCASLQIISPVKRVNGCENNIHEQQTADIRFVLTFTCWYFARCMWLFSDSDFFCSCSVLPRLSLSHWNGNC